MIKLGNLLKEETFTATNKKTGNTSVFKSKEHRDAAIKAGTHTAINDKVKSTTKVDTTNVSKKVNKSTDLPAISKETGKNENYISEKIVNLLSKIKSYSLVYLYRKNKNGKLVDDVTFSQKDITPEILKKIADKCDIDLNLLMKYGLDTATKPQWSTRKVPMSELVFGLIYGYVKASQYAPGEIAEDDYLYKNLSNDVKEQADFIRKQIDPVSVEKDKEKSNKEELYNEISVEDISNSLLKLKNNIIGKPTFTKKQIANVANKYKIDINRILKNPQIYFDISGYTPTKRDLKDFGYENETDYVLTNLGDTIYFGKDNDVDSMTNLANFQLAYPLKYKTLSDEEWSAKIEDEKTNPTTVDNALRNFTQSESKENPMADKVSDANTKNQTKWVKEQSKKNVSYGDTMYAYQSLISKPALNRIDELLKSSPPPTIKAKVLYRGMAMKPKDYSKFMQSFKDGNNIDLPISSFSFDASVATGFSNNVNNDNALIDKANNQSVMIKVVNQKNEFNGFAMNANIDNADRVNKDTFDSDFSAWDSQKEVLMPSNNKYKVVKTEVKKFEDGRSFTVITLDQIGIKTEIKLREFIDDEETDILKKHLQYPNRLSLLYKKEK